MQILPSIIKLDDQLSWPFISRMTPLVIEKVTHISKTEFTQEAANVAVECFKVIDFLVTRENDNDSKMSYILPGYIMLRFLWYVFCISYNANLYFISCICLYC